MTIFYILNIYFIYIEVIPSLTISIIALTYAHLLYRRLTIFITTTYLFSN
jgi:hypothetical protein